MSSARLVAGAFAALATLSSARLLAAAAPTHRLAFTTPRVVQTLPDTDTRRPVVVYYAVDSRERFMQLAVNHEILALRQACVTHPGNVAVNWVAFVNSWYVKDRLVMVCRAGELSATHLVSPRIEARRGWLATHDPASVIGSFDNPLIFGQSFANSAFSFPKELGAGYADYPFADYEIMREALAFASDLFPRKSHVHFLHVKAHGSAALSMSAITEERLAARAAAENAQLERLEIDPAALPTVAYGEVGRGELTPDALLAQYPALAKAGLADVGFGDFGFTDEPGAPDKLFQIGPAAQSGLGWDSNQGVDDFGVAGVEGASPFQYFGTAKGEMEQALRRKHPNTPAEDYGFVFFESCNSRILPDDASKNEVAALFSTRGTLWYRNVDWQALFARLAALETPRPRDLQTFLLRWTAKIPTFEPVVEGVAESSFYKTCVDPALTPSQKTTVARLVKVGSGRDTVDAASCAEAASYLMGAWFLDLGVGPFDGGITELSPLATLPHLRLLNLHNNAVADLSPLTGLAALEALDVAGSKVVDVSPLVALPKLTRLAVTLRTSAQAATLAGLTHLRELRLLQAEKLTDLTFLAGLSEVELLDVQSQVIQSAEGVLSSPALRTLRLVVTRTPLAGEQNPNFTAFPVPPAGHPLEELSLSDNALSDLTAIGSLAGLRRLEIGVAALTDVSPLAKLAPTLVELQVRAPLSVDLLPQLQPLVNLRALDLRCLKGPLLSLDALPKAPGLEKLYLVRHFRTSCVPDAIGDVEPIASAYPALRELHLGGHMPPSFAPLEPLAPTLRSLSLGGMGLTSVPSPITTLVHLRELLLDDNALTDVTPLGTLKELQRLSLKKQKQPGIASIAPLAELPETALQETTSLDVTTAALPKTEDACPVTKGPWALRRICRGHRNP